VPNSFKHSRNCACINQSSICYYCEVVMAVSGGPQFARRYGLSLCQAKRHRPTAEHLQARCEGGSNAATNIVAACWHCNSLRHRCRQPMDPASYKRHVQRRMSKGKWHQRYVFERLLKSTKNLPQVPLTPGRGLVGDSAATRAARFFHSGRPGARSRRDTKQSDWHQRGAAGPDYRY
jgi:hypothetical protein